ncbi:arsenate reductase family protein [Campylobacter jejuni]
MTEAKAIALMLANPTLIKRPVLEAGDALLLGFKPDEYAARLA